MVQTIKLSTHWSNANVNHNDAVSILILTALLNCNFCLMECENMNNKKKSLFLLLIIIGLTGCATNKYEEQIKKSKDSILPIYKERELEKKNEKRGLFEQKPISGYKQIVWEKNTTTIGAPAGIICRESDIIVVDGDTDQLVVLSPQGQFIRRVGQTGNGKVEFLQPTGITYKDNYIYVIDYGNSRIQVLNDDFEFIQEYPIEMEKEPDTIIRDIEVDNEQHIYLSGETRERKILKYSITENKTELIGDNFFGYLAQGDNRIFALNTGSYYLPKESNVGGFGMANGKNLLLEIQDNGLASIAEFPFGLYTYDLLINKNTVTFLNGAYHSVVLFDLAGNYQGTIGEIAQDDMNGYIAIDLNGTYYVTGNNTGNIYSYSKVSNE